MDTNTGAATLVGSNDVNCTINGLAWMDDCEIAEISLSPATATNDVGTDHTITATVDTDGVPEPDALVAFEVISGPSAGLVSITNNGECTP